LKEGTQGPRDWGWIIVSGIIVGAEDRVFVLTGAGVSAESGLPTFRASDGLWEGYRIEDVCTPEAWDRDPAGVWAFYSARRAAAARAEPNPGHVALAELESQLPGRFFLCTQNVDDLHERAGSVNLVAKSRCERECGAAPVEDRRVYADLKEVSRCACGGGLRPHIVFFGEIPLEMERIEREIEKATLMVVVGTSGSVYPAANFVHWARRTGARTVYVGPEEPQNASAFTNVVLGKAGVTLPGLFVAERD